MTETPLTSSSPESARPDPISFDLAPELALAKETRSARSVSAGLAAGLGAFLLFFAILLLVGRTPGGTAVAIVLVLAAVALFALSIRAGRSVTPTEASELVIDDQGIRFGPPGGRTVRVDWNDPSFKVDLRQFTADRDEVLRTGDPRSTYPQWLSFFAPPRRSPRIETVVPVEAIPAILRAAEGHGLTVRPVKVGFYWYHVARGPGFLAYEVEGDLQRARTINGVITRLRGPAWASYPDE
ncbi:MAG: hypothetical protein ACLP8Y_00805 [Thermoplasmata archaeon]